MRFLLFSGRLRFSSTTIFDQNTLHAERAAIRPNVNFDHASVLTLNEGSNGLSGARPLSLV